MKNLLKWELKETFSAKSFWGIGAALVLCSLLLGLAALSESGNTGLDVFLQICNNFNALLIFFVGIHAGIHTTKAFEERRIQAAVMAGHSRSAIMAVKLLSFSLTIALYCLCTLALGGAISFGAKGMGDMGSDFFREVILRTALYTTVEVAFASLCFLAAVLVKTLGASIATNLIVALGLNTLAQELVSHPWAEGIMRFTPAGQTFLLLADASTKNLWCAFAASLLTLGAVLVIACRVFGREELK